MRNELDEVEGHVEVLRKIDALLDPEADTWKNREALPWQSHLGARLRAVLM